MWQANFIRLISRYWKLNLLAAFLLLAAAGGTFLSGQYRIGKLDALIARYSNAIQDYAAANARARQGTLESDLLESCKQAQIGTWLQTTDAIRFVNPVAGNRITVRLLPDRDYLDINGRELASCITDEIEERQFDIGSMSSGWAVALLVSGLIFGVMGLWGWDLSRRFRVQAAAASAVNTPVQ